MTTRFTALRSLFLFLLTLTAMAATTSHVSAQDVVLQADFAVQTDGNCTFKDAGNPSVTTGSFAGPDGDKGWTYVKDGNDLLVYNESGELMMTFTGANNSSNGAGPIQDAGSTPNWGGNWRR